VLIFKDKSSKGTPKLFAIEKFERNSNVLLKVS